MLTHLREITFEMNPQFGTPIDKGRIKTTFWELIAFALPNSSEIHK
jgi:hypothetical protein